MADPNPGQPFDQDPPIVEPAAIPLEYAGPTRRRSNLGWVIPTMSVLAIFVIGLALSIIPISVNPSRERANRVKCSSNLRQIGQGILLYSNDNKGVYPRTRYNVNGKLTWFTGAADTHPFTGTAVQDNDVTAALFLLVRNADINPEVFICPSTNHDKDTLGGLSPDQRSNFHGPNNLSYSYTNPYPRDNTNDPKAPVQLGYKISGSVSATFAIAADRNDGTIKGNMHITSASPNSDHKKLNSKNHEGDGQNVLFNDGHVEWATTPFIGHDKDMIYGIAVTNGASPPKQKDPAAFEDVGYDPQTDLDTILMPRKDQGF